MWIFRYQNLRAHFLFINDTFKIVHMAYHYFSALFWIINQKSVWFRTPEKNMVGYLWGGRILLFKKSVFLGFSISARAQRAPKNHQNFFVHIENFCIWQIFLILSLSNCKDHFHFWKWPPPHKLTLRRLFL